MVGGRIRLRSPDEDRRKSTGTDHTDTGYTSNEADADCAVRFFEELLCHGKGEWAGQPFKLEPWQANEIIRPLGWKRPDGTRRYRTVYVENGFRGHSLSAPLVAEGSRARRLSAP